MNDMNDKKGHGKSNIRFIYLQLQYVTVTCNIPQNINNIVFIIHCISCILLNWTFPRKKSALFVETILSNRTDWQIINYINSFAKDEKVVWLVDGTTARCSIQLIKLAVRARGNMCTATHVEKRSGNTSYLSQSISAGGMSVKKNEHSNIFARFNCGVWANIATWECSWNFFARHPNMKSSSSFLPQKQKVNNLFPFS